jgi:MFS transporter, DHA2 family, multidrug resistance protein
MAEPVNPPLLRGWPLFAMTMGLAIATFMEVLDITVANVSLPTIAGDLAVSPTQGTWVITGYGVANAITVLLAGWLAQRFGEVRVFILCALAFAASSFMCGWAGSLGFLIACRVMQGAVAGPMVTMSQALLLRNFAPQRRGLAMSIWGITVIVAPLVGPILGGYITDNFNWRWIFLINVPIALIAALAVWQTLRKRETERRRVPVDYIGFALVVIGVGSLQVLLDKGKELDWLHSEFIVALAIISAIALTTLIIWELGERTPVVNLKLFMRRNFVVSVCVMAVAYASMFAGIVLMPLFLQTQLDYTATWAGLVVAPVGILSLMLTPIIGPRLPRLNLRLVITTAMVIFAIASFWRASFNTGADYWRLAAPQLLQGAAISMYFAPLVLQYTADLPPALFASASSLMNFTRMLAGAVATSIVTTVWDQRAAVHQTTLVGHMLPGAPGYDSATAALAAIGLGPVGTGAVLARTISQQAYMLAANEIYLWLGVVFLALIGVVWLARPARVSAAPVAAH